MGKKNDKFAIPDVKETMPIENVIADLRKDITIECADILRKSRELNVKTQGTKKTRVRDVEIRVNQIVSASKTSFNINELKQLKRQCQTISHELLISQ
jgi:phage terminase small subunit